MRLLTALTFAVCIAPVAHGQAAPAPEAAPKKNVVHVLRPPASAKPSIANQLSTAQRAALFNDKPTLKQLPAFTATDRNGARVAATAIPQSSHWLLVYRRQTCLACDRLMTVLAASGTAAPKNGKPYVILVGGKQPNGLEIVRAKYAALGDATWLADTDDQVLAALKPKGAPTVYGMDGANVMWTVPGNLGDPARVATMASAWLATPPTPAPTSTSAVAPTTGSSAK